MLKFNDKITKESLETFLEERQRNYVWLSFDLMFSKSVLPIEEEKKAKELQIEIDKLEKELEIERMKTKKERNREKVIVLEEKLNGKFNSITKQETIGLKQKFGEFQVRINKARDIVQEDEIRLKVEEKLINALQDCISNPSKVYGW